MSLSIAIALNAIADLGLLGGLAFAMTRPARLRPHHRPSASVIRLQTVRGDAEWSREAA